MAAATTSVATMAKSNIRLSAGGCGLKVDITPRLSHPSHVRAALRHIIVLTVIAAAVAGDVRLCAGWHSTPEARMDCCQDESDCPMHSDQTLPAAHSTAVSQAQADACCATSEQGSSRSTSQVTALQQPALLVSIAGAPTVVPVPAASGDSRQPLASNSPPIARYLLLSVIIV